MNTREIVLRTIVVGLFAATVSIPAASAADQVQRFHRGCAVQRPAGCHLLTDDLSTLPSGADLHFMPAGETITCPISFPELVAGSDVVKQVAIELQVALDPASSGTGVLEVQLNGTSLGSMTISDPTKCFNIGTSQPPQFVGFTLVRQTFRSTFNPSGVPGFVYGGGANIVTLTSGGSPINVFRLQEYDITYDHAPFAVSFDLADTASEVQRRVLIGKAEDGDSYFSADQHEDGRMQINATVTENGVPAAGKMIYFRVVDPADSAAYVPPPERIAGDNRGGAGRLSVMQATSDATGRVGTVLTVTGQYSGDNYQVLASAEPSGTDGRFPCETGTGPCPHSGVLTAWKRIYLEKKNMFRRGAFLVDDVPVGDRRVPVSDSTPFAAGQRVMLIHGPRLQRVNSASTPLPSPPADFFVSEENVIDHVEPASAPDPAFLVLQRGVGTAYGMDRSFTSSSQSPGVPYLADAVGVITGSPGDYFVANPAYLNTPFNAAFVDYVNATPLIPAIPYYQQMDFNIANRIAQKWYENSVRGLNDSIANLPNHRQLVGGSRLADGPHNGARLGVTIGGTHNPSWVFVRRIELGVTESPQPIYQLDPDRVNGEVTTHELVHQWHVNPDATLAGATEGHCLEQDYRAIGAFCLMHAPFYAVAHNGEFGDGLVVLHYRRVTGTVDSEYVTIRAAADPLPRH